jgi:hypothetical protein
MNLIAQIASLLPLETHLLFVNVLMDITKFQNNLFAKSVTINALPVPIILNAPPALDLIIVFKVNFVIVKRDILKINNPFVKNVITVVKIVQLSLNVIDVLKIRLDKILQIAIVSKGILKTIPWRNLFVKNVYLGVKHVLNSQSA